jgi:hypothetical protein
MKKRQLTLLLVIALNAAAAFAQTGTIDTSIAALKSHIEHALPPGSRVLVLCGGTVKTAADYAADELSARLVNGKKLRVAERSAEILNALNTESDYQRSGEVDYDTIQEIGGKTGAEFVINGNISGGGDSYRLVVKAASVKTGELAGQWNLAFQSSPALEALLANANPPKGKPAWIDEPLAAAEKHGASGWYYDVGVSNKAASEQLARTRARQNVQLMVAENIASEIHARIDITAFSVFQSSSVEETENRIEAALTNSIRTTVPRYEPLEWHIETGKQNGKDYYLAYVLVRFPRKDIITMVEKLDPPRIAETIFRQMNIQVTEVSLRTELVEGLETARSYALETIQEE